MTELKKLALCAIAVVTLVAAYSYAISQYRPKPPSPAHNPPRW